METVIKNKDCFDGTGDVKSFISKVELISALKGYTDEKLSKSLASNLEGDAFNVYLSMSTDDQKDVEKIKQELLSEYEVGAVDREQAVVELSSRSRLQNEPAKTYAFKLQQLVKLAYPDFTDNARNQIAKDAYVKGLHPDLQLQLKSLEKFATADLKTIVTETTRLEVAGITSALSVRPKVSINTVRVEDATDTVCVKNLDNRFIQNIGDLVVEKLKGESVNYTRDPPIQGTSSQYRSRAFEGSSQGYKQQKYLPSSKNPLKCRNCGKTSNFVRNCPSRFCASCGERGYDFWSKQCPKYL